MSDLIRRKQPGEAWETAVDTGGGGGSQPGASVVRGPFTINYDDANLNNGIAFYTPAVGDFLLDIRVIVDTVFDGTTPKIDVSATATGIFAALAGSFLEGSVADASTVGLLIGAAYNDLIGAGAYANVLSASLNPFLTADPLKVWASQDGLKGGTAVGGTAGVARIYIVTATPVAL